MADKEKRRSGAAPPGAPEGKPTKSDNDKEFLSQAGVGLLLRGAILKLVEARSDDPIGFLADHFCHLASASEIGGAAAGCGDADRPTSSPLSTGGALEQQHLNRALWHLRLVHHSQRSGHVRLPVITIVSSSSRSSSNIVIINIDVMSSDVAYRDISTIQLFIFLLTLLDI